MDGYDLFRKLSAGAKFDFKRFRSDAEKLHIIRPSRHGSKAKANSHKEEKGGKKTTDVIAKTVDDRPKDGEEDSDASTESDSDTEQISSKVNHNTDDFFDHDNDKNVDDDDDDDDISEEDQSSDSESENELKILGNMKSLGAVSDKKKIREERKKRKLGRKKSDKVQADLKQEEINRIRRKNHVHVYGTDVPDPIESFELLKDKYNVHKHIVRNIETAGYKAPTPIQLQAIPVMLSNRDILACAPTGSGKTAAFILPVLHHLKEPRNEGVRALILAPTRELAKQTYREFQRLSEGMGFRMAYVDKIGKDLEKIKKTFRKTDIMVSTPNRLVYLLEQTPPLISLTSVKWLIVDESDKLFEDGKTGFRDQLATIYKSCDGSVRRAMFSATFTYDVEQWCKLNLDNVIQVYIGAKNTATKTVEQTLLFCGSEHGKLLAMRGIIKEGIEPPVLVFVQSKDRAKELFHELIYDGMNVDVIHSERTQTQRDNVVKCFRSGKIWILICTELMGRGIDFKGVNLVINYDFPNSAISYIHRIGRTGRAGRPGKAVTFFSDNDAVFLRSIAGVMKSAGCPVPDYMLKMNKPSKQNRKKLARSCMDRDRISTAPRNMPEVLQKKVVHHKDRSSNWKQGKSGDQSNKNKRKNNDGDDPKNFKKRKTDGEHFQKGKSQGNPKNGKQFDKPKRFNGYNKKKASFAEKNNMT